MTLHVVSITILFTGVCLFARELGNKNMGRIAAIMLLVTATIAIAGGLLAGAVDAQDATPIGRLWVLTLSALCAGVVWHARRNSTPVYGRAMAWLSAALVLGAVTHGLGFVLWLAGEGTSPLILLPYFVMGPLYVAAGYAFNKIREY